MAKATPPATSSLPASVGCQQGTRRRDVQERRRRRLPKDDAQPITRQPITRQPITRQPCASPAGLGGPIPGGPLPGGPAWRPRTRGGPMPGGPMPGGPMPGRPMPGGPMPGGPASGRRATTASAPATAPITNANASRSPSETDEGAAAHRHDDDILPSKPRASFRMRLASRPLLAPKGTTYPQSAAPSPIVARPSLRERANGVSQLLSGRLRAYSRGRGSS